MFPQIITLNIDDEGYRPIRNKTQECILNLLLKNKNMSVKQIARRLHRNYSTIYEEVQIMKDYGQILKDNNKRYFPNPKYGEYLIYTGLEVVGLNDHDNVLILQRRFGRLQKKLNRLEHIIRYVEKSIRKVLKIAG